MSKKELKELLRRNISLMEGCCFNEKTTSSKCGLSGADSELEVQREQLNKCNNFPSWQPGEHPTKSGFERDVKVRKSITIHEDMTKEEAFRKVNEFFGVEEDCSWFKFLNNNSDIDWYEGYVFAREADDAETGEYGGSEENLLSWFEKLEIEPDSLSTFATWTDELLSLFGLTEGGKFFASNKK